MRYGALPPVWIEGSSPPESLHSSVVAAVTACSDPRAMTAVLILLGCGFAACALALVLYSILRAKRQRFARLRDSGRAADGVVAARPALAAGDVQQEMPALVVEFADTSGRRHRVRSGGASTMFPRLGATVRVYYDPNDPSDAVIEVDMDNANLIGPLLTGVFGVLGGLTILAGLIVLAVELLID